MGWTMPIDKKSGTPSSGILMKMQQRGWTKQHLPSWMILQKFWQNAINASSFVSCQFIKDCSNLSKRDSRNCM